MGSRETVELLVSLLLSSQAPATVHPTVELIGLMATFGTNRRLLQTCEVVPRLVAWLQDGAGTAQLQTSVANTLAYMATTDECVATQNCLLGFGFRL